MARRRKKRRGGIFGIHHPDPVNRQAMKSLSYKLKPKEIIPKGNKFCPACGETFATPAALARHVSKEHPAQLQEQASFTQGCQCLKCNVILSDERAAMARHLKEKHGIECGEAALDAHFRFPG